MNAFGDATFALALFLLIQRAGSLDFKDVFARRRRTAREHRRDPDRARAPRRRGGQVGAGAAPHLASGRDGGPDARLGPHPRGDDGHRRRLLDRPHERPLRARAVDPGSRGSPRRGHDRRRRADRARPDRHQARHRLFDDEPDRLHVRRRRPGRVRRRALPPDDARLLQGAPLHGRGHRHPRAHGRAGHPQDGRARASAPYTYRAFIVGALALAAIPPFAGFFSKDSILGSAANAGAFGWILWSGAAFGAFLTALYTFRLLFIVFWGELIPFAREHLHVPRFECGLAMAWPVGVLTVSVGGFAPGAVGLAARRRLAGACGRVGRGSTGFALTFSVRRLDAIPATGICVAWRLVGAAEAPARAAAAALPVGRAHPRGEVLLRHRVRPGVLRARSTSAVLATRYVEEPVFLRSLGGLGRGVRFASARLSLAPDGLGALLCARARRGRSRSSPSSSSW